MIRTGWVQAPPAPCYATGNDEPARGPYYVESIMVARIGMGADGALRPQTPVRPVVLSVGHLRTICDDPRSPVRLITPEEAAAHLQAADDLAGARERIAELESELAALRSGLGAIDVQALASALVVPLRDEFARKTGPKPKAAA